MGTSDLIRLAQELAECGGVHRLTSLINAAVHVTLEHERRGEEVGVGMSDKVAPAPETVCPRCGRGDTRCWADTTHGYCDFKDTVWMTPSEAEYGGLGGPETDRGVSTALSATAGVIAHNGRPVLHCGHANGPCLGGCYDHGWCKADPNPPPGMLRNPAPLTSINGERKQLPQSDCQDEYPRGGISHEPDSPLLRCQDDFGRRERKVPKFDGRRINPEDLGDGA